MIVNPLVAFLKAIVNIKDAVVVGKDGAVSFDSSKYTEDTLKLLRSRLWKADGHIIRYLGNTIIEPIIFMTHNAYQSSQRVNTVDLNTDLFASFIMNAINIMTNVDNLTAADALSLVSSQDFKLEKVIEDVGVTVANQFTTMNLSDAQTTDQMIQVKIHSLKQIVENDIPMLESGDILGSVSNKVADIISMFRASSKSAFTKGKGAFGMPGFGTQDDEEKDKDNDLLKDAEPELYDVMTLEDLEIKQRLEMDEFNNAINTNRRNLEQLNDETDIDQMIAYGGEIMTNLTEEERDALLNLCELQDTDVVTGPNNQNTTVGQIMTHLQQQGVDPKTQQDYFNSLNLKHALRNRSRANNVLQKIRNNRQKQHLEERMQFKKESKKNSNLKDLLAKKAEEERRQKIKQSEPKQQQITSNKAPDSAFLKPHDQIFYGLHMRQYNLNVKDRRAELNGGTKAVEFIIPITVKAVVIVVSPEDLTEALQPFDKKDKGFFARLYDWKVGLIDSSDFFFGTDLVQKYREYRFKGKDKLAKIINSRINASTSKVISNSAQGFAKNYNMFIVAPEDKFALQQGMQENLDTDAGIQNFLTTGHGLIYTVIDENYNRIEMSMSTLKGKTTMGFDKLEKRGKSDKALDSDLIVSLLGTQMPKSFL